MIYGKPFQSFDEQAELLLQRGLAADRQLLVETLGALNYYRLSGYLFPYRRDNDRFQPNTSLDRVMSHYRFDGELRALVLRGLESIEVALRTQLAYHHSEAFGPFGYTSRDHLPGLATAEFDRWLKELLSEFGRSSEVWARHYRTKYGHDQPEPPVWMVVESMTFGKAVTFFRGSHPRIQKAVSGFFGLADTLFESWLKTLNEVRNVCAHHGRLWNRELGNNPLLPSPNKHPDWHSPRVGQDRMFVVTLMLRTCLRRAEPSGTWHRSLEELLDRYPDTPLAWMGFPDHWKEHALWQ